MTYQPHPTETQSVRLRDDLMPLLERLAEHAHDIWALQRIAEGWSYGPQRDERRKVTPLLVPYHDLSESDKQVDRNMVCETLKAVKALGYEIVPAHGRKT